MLFKTVLISFIIIAAIILIKYEPKYQVLIDNNKIGYVNSKNDLDNYLEETMNIAKSSKIAFVNIEKLPTLKLQLVSRNIDNQENLIKEELENQLKIEYTSYAITLNGENKVYVSNMEEAQSIVDEIKKDYNEKYTKNIGILKVYSQDYNEISPIKNQEAKSKICKEIKLYKNTNSVRIAKNTKSSNINGIKFTVKPVSGIITSRFGRRTSPGGIGSTNHKGLDISAKSGTSIYAAAPGKIIYSGYKGALGKLIIIDHGSGVLTYYGHCSGLLASTGNKVNAGEKIATVGKTGSATGYHLHFEVHVNGKVVNPQKYIY